MQYADLPSVDSLVSECNADTELPHAVVVAVCREAIDEARAAIDRGDGAANWGGSRRRAARRTSWWARGISTWPGWSGRLSATTR